MKEKISVKGFVEEFLNKKVTNNKINEHAVEDYIRSKLDIIEYLPFKTKREVVETVLEKVIIDENGVKRVDSISQFLYFVITMIASHTTLEFGENPIDDYDILSRCGLLENIIAMFQKDYAECDALLKAAIADELADNNLNVIIGKFLNGILEKLDGVVDAAKVFAENIDLSKFGIDVNEENIAKIIGLLNKLK